MIALGRCQLFLYNPDGVLVDVTSYIGATYGEKLQTSESLFVRAPKEGVWELVVVSADNLSLYQHFESYGMIRVQADMR